MDSPAASASSLEAVRQVHSKQPVPQSPQARAQKDALDAAVSARGGGKLPWPNLGRLKPGVGRAGRGLKHLGNCG